MQLTLFESGRSFLQSAEWAAVSIVAHAGVVWLALAATEGGPKLPTGQREARVFFLLPPDRVAAPLRQSETIRWSKLGSDLKGGIGLALSGEAGTLRTRAYGARRAGERLGAPGKLPFGRKQEYSPDSVYSVLQVDQMVERFEGSAAPVYPPELSARGTEGLVEATYVVDTTGRVDTTTFHLLQSNHPLFTQSVRTALAEMRFRPAKRAGRPVRQLVAQRFRFRSAQPPQGQAAGN
jgi:TonB family protein